VPAQVASADSIAGFTLQQCLDIALRASAKRIVFAEIRGAEGPVALKAMQAGKGSMSTIHARSADDAIHRFADVLMSELGLSSDVVPLRQIGRSIDLMIYIDFLEAEDGTHRRVVTEVAEVVLNDQHQPMAAKLFEYRPETDSWVRPEKPSEKIQPRLLRVGYDWTKEMS
jgi:Flp pilus assembly CpaF family ATPase